MKQQQPATNYSAENDALHERIEKDFRYHPPKGDQPERYASITDATRQVAHLFANLCPPGRQLSLALTALEEARMRANQAIAIGEADL